MSSGKLHSIYQERTPSTALEKEWSVNLDGFSLKNYLNKNVGSKDTLHIVWNALRTPCLVALIGM